MPLAIICPNCGRQSSVSDKFADRQLTCPDCQQQFLAGDHKAPPPPEKAAELPPGFPMTFDGAGILVGPIWLACMIVTILIVDGIAGDRRYCFGHTWPWSVGCFLAGAIIGPLGWYLNHRGSDSVDNTDSKPSGKPARPKPKHSFRGIAMEYCGLFIALIGVTMPIFQMIEATTKD